MADDADVRLAAALEAEGFPCAAALASLGAESKREAMLAEVRAAAESRADDALVYLADAVESWRGPHFGVDFALYERRRRGA